MDLGLLTSPDDKVWLNIVANSYRITGDGSFGSDGNAIPVTGTATIPAFTNFFPNTQPTIGANSLKVGSTFSGVLYAEATTVAGGSLVSVTMNWGGVAVLPIIINLQSIPLFTTMPIRIYFEVGVLVDGEFGSGYADYTVVVGGNATYPVFRLYQNRVGVNINTIVDLPVTITGSWNNPSAENVLRIFCAWMRREI